MTSFQMLCSSPNWFQSSVCDSSCNGIVAIGTHNKVTLLSVMQCLKTTQKLKTEKSQKTEYLFIGELLHNDRVNAVKFCFISSKIDKSFNKQSENAKIECLVTGSSDGSVRIWSVEQKKCFILSRHSEFGSISSIAANNKNLIIFGNAKGRIFCWNPFTNNRSQRRFDDSSAMTLKLCPFDDEQIAVGFKSGKLLMLKVSEYEMSKTLILKGHDAEIQSIEWCKNTNSALCKSDSPHLIISNLPNVFVTASKDRFIRFWHCLSGECLLEMQIENKSKYKLERFWYCVLWPLPFKFFVTTSNGKILVVDFKKCNFSSLECLNRRKRKDGIYSFEQGHSRCVFTMIQLANNRILSSSLDRNIVFYDAATLKIKWKQPTLGGFVYDLDIAKWDKQKIAICCGDKMIRIWADGKFKIIWKGLKDQITAIKWHPTDRDWLLYGTNRGVIGCMDTCKQIHHRFLSFHRSLVCAVEWKFITMQNRKKSKTESGIRAYSLSTNGHIFESNGWKPNDASIDIDEYVSTQNTNFKINANLKWTAFCIDDKEKNENNKNGQNMVIGCNEGKVFIFDGSWKILQCFDDYNLSICSIQINPFSNLICCGTQNGELIFYEMQSTQMNILFKLKHCGKNKAVTKVKWHSFCENVIVSISTSLKCPLRIWNIKTKQKIFEIASNIHSKPKNAHFANYHHSKILSVAWSRCDPFVLYSASEDQTCRVLNILDFVKRDLSKIDELEFASFECSKLSQPIIDEKEIKKEQKQKQSKLKQKKHKKLANSSDATNKIDDSLMILIEYLATNKLRKDHKLSPNDALFLRNCDVEKDKIANWISQNLQPQNCGIYPMEFLPSPSNQIPNFLMNESEQIIEREIDSFVNVKNEKKLPKLPSLISLLMSPSLSRTKWIKSMLKLCEYYRHPQIALFHNAAAIYLSLRSPQFIKECVEMYIDNEYYFEALFVARFHFVSSHPIFECILNKYAQKSMQKKQYHLAIKCHLAKLSMYAFDDYDVYIEHFVENMKQNVFGILLKFYFFNSFQSEFEGGITKKRKISKMEIHSLRILHDLIILLYSMKHDKIMQFLEEDIGTKVVCDIFGIYSLLKLCVFNETTIELINKWTFMEKSEQFLWKLLFEFVAIFEVNKYENVNFQKYEQSFDGDELVKTYKNLKLSQRIDHIFKGYHLQKSKEQNRRIHAVRFAVFLLECFVFRKEVDCKIWNALEYASNHNKLLILHQFIGCVQLFYTQCSALNLVFGSLQIVSSENETNEQEIMDISMKFKLVITEMAQSEEDRVKCKIMIRFFALLLFSINYKIRAKIDHILDESFWSLMKNVMNDPKVDNMDSLISKCIQSLLRLNKSSNDPCIRRLKSKQIALECIFSIIYKIENKEEYGAAIH